MLHPCPFGYKAIGVQPAPSVSPGDWSLVSGSDLPTAEARSRTARNSTAQSLRPWRQSRGWDCNRLDSP